MGTRTIDIVQRGLLEAFGRDTIARFEAHREAFPSTWTGMARGRGSTRPPHAAEGSPLSKIRSAKNNFFYCDFDDFRFGVALS